VWNCQAKNEKICKFFMICQFFFIFGAFYTYFFITFNGGGVDFQTLQDYFI